MYTQKKDLIGSKKIICLKGFLWFQEMIYLNWIKFVWFKQIIFEPNKNLFKSNKLYLWLYINPLISLFWRKIYLIETNIYVPQRYFIQINQMFFNLNKSLVWIKKKPFKFYFHPIKSSFTVKVQKSFFTINFNFHRIKVRAALILFGNRLI